MNTMNQRINLSPSHHDSNDTLYDGVKQQQTLRVVLVRASRAKQKPVTTQLIPSEAFYVMCRSQKRIHSSENPRQAGRVQSGTLAAVTWLPPVGQAHAATSTTVTTLRFSVGVIWGEEGGRGRYINDSKSLELQLL